MNQANPETSPLAYWMAIVWILPLADQIKVDKEIRENIQLGSKESKKTSSIRTSLFDVLKEHNIVNEYNWTSHKRSIHQTSPEILTRIQKAYSINPDIVNDIIIQAKKRSEKQVKKYTETISKLASSIALIID